MLFSSSCLLRVARASPPPPPPLPLNPVLCPRTALPRALSTHTRTLYKTHTENEPSATTTAARPPPTHPPPRARSPPRLAPPRPPAPGRPGANSGGGLPPPRRAPPPLQGSPLIALLRLPFTALRAAAAAASALASLLSRPGLLPRPLARLLAPLLRPRPPVDPAADAAAFAGAWEAAHGPGRGPAWAPLGWRAAADAAAASHALLFVYLRSPRHSHTPAFDADTLCAADVTAELGCGRYVAWGGNVDASSDAAALAGALRVRAYPAVALLRGPASRAALAAAAEGATTPRALLDMLAAAAVEHGPALAAARGAAAAREADRALRAEQDAAYEAALVADREREASAAASRAEVEARERAEAEAAAAAQRAAKEAAAAAAAAAAALAARAAAAAAALPPEPPAGEPGTATLRVRLREDGAGNMAAPSASNTTRRFRGTDPPASVYAWVDSLPGQTCLAYDLVTAFPRSVLPRGGSGGEADGGLLTLASLGLTPQAALLVEPRD